MEMGVGAGLQLSADGVKSSVTESWGHGGPADSRKTQAFLSPRRHPFCDPHLLRIQCCQDCLLKNKDKRRERGRRLASSQLWPSLWRW